ncbi:chemotaxis response regulator protein-glutamate methylesterase [Sporosarcina sp. Sa2YVA2]|uniref:Protein-glutamate methylesterase/protein-glutamine glutaminase n=1 Tax=Sporosarcina quadrami TaxID=2762234 RepID=A0ABR8U7U0_9BACL|nr:chemotaxis response regulator protein-glutamate methylesterase [Sporosarcina quadrami]MBD7983549.1 chemotaxis response regulator protein-glutamate methylesterase [Sporosarcina quadrami]
MRSTESLKKVLVVDDSAFMRKLISDMLSKHPLLEIVGIARNGKDALAKVVELKPDVITMDIEMPLMNGLEALQQIMKHQPTPIVMLSSTTETGARNTMMAMEYGAVDFIAKPGGPISLNLQDVEQEIIEKVVAASKVNVKHLVNEYNVQKSEKKIQAKPIETSIYDSLINPPKKHITSEKNLFSKMYETFVIIGTSTGGPRALQEVLTRLPASLQVPILIVQHMPAGFTKSLALRLDGLSEIRVKEAEDGEVLEKGVAYIAPGGKHMKMKKCSLGYCVLLDDSELPRKGHRPAVDVLLESAALQNGLQFVTVIMTGMGYDGREGMQKLKDANPTITIAESEKTSVVYGMPKAINDAGLADRIEDLQNISTAIIETLQP